MTDYPDPMVLLLFKLFVVLYYYLNYLGVNLWGDVEFNEDSIFMLFAFFRLFLVAL